MNFYQNQIRRTISWDIFKKDIFEISIFWKKYRWIRKTHKKFWIAFHWYQVLWIEIPNKITDKNFAYEITNIKNKFSNFNDIFFQLWFIDSFQEPFFQNRIQIETDFQTKYGLQASIKENMPLASVVIDLTKSEDEIYTNFNKSAKRNINKAKKNDLYFKIANDKEVIEFYDLWAKTAFKKWFGIYPKHQYLKLISFLKSTWTWDLYIVKKDDVILSWSVEITENNYSYYLYWATNRDYFKIWWHYFLKYEMFKFLKTKWVKKVDLVWVSPEWKQDHHLKWVSQFKHSLGWEHVEYVWNYDIVLNKLLYKIIKKIY